MKDSVLESLLTFKFIPGLGNVLIRQLIGYCGGIEAVLSEKPGRLQKIPGIGPKTIAALKDAKSKYADKVAEQMDFIKSKKVNAVHYLDKNYPQRLKELKDAPLLLFHKGDFSLNAPRTVAIVGTRRPSFYGKDRLAKIVKGLHQYNVQIISGLAYGIDQAAHQNACDLNIPNIGVLGHGLDRIYPFQHKALSEQMVKQGGGLLTEYIYGIKPERDNFPARNRIIAGMADAVLVIETKKSGGSMITAKIAFSYNRDVFALPGNVGIQTSEGCNGMIKNNSAYLMETADDVAEQMGWNGNAGLNLQFEPEPKAAHLLAGKEKEVYEILKGKRQLHKDELTHAVAFSAHELSSILLNMELKGLVKQLPGNFFCTAL